MRFIEIKAKVGASTRDEHIHINPEQVVSVRASHTAGETHVSEVKLVTGDLLHVEEMASVFVERLRSLK